MLFKQHSVLIGTGAALKLQACVSGFGSLVAMLCWRCTKYGLWISSWKGRLPYSKHIYYHIL